MEAAPRPRASSELASLLYDQAARMNRAAKDLSAELAHGSADVLFWEQRLHDAAPLCAALHPTEPRLEPCPYFADHHGDHRWVARPVTLSTRRHTLARAVQLR